MSDVAEGIGGAIEGALAGRAVEPGSGGARDVTHDDGSDGDRCLNCGAIALENFCANCGQKTKIHRTLSAIGHDLIHGVLHLDGKLWRTLPLLTFKPGKLTRRYIDGERAQFVSPMAMFLFSVFAMFAVFQMVGLTTPTDFQFDSREQLAASLENQAASVREDLAAVDARLADENLTPGLREELEERRGELAVEIQSIEEAGNLPFFGSADSSAPAPPALGEPIPISEDGNTQMTLGPTGIEWLDEGLGKKWQENPGLMLYKLQANAYKFSWLLIPLSIPFVWLTFAWRRRFRAYDHAIFVTYSLGFMSLLFIAGSVLATVLDSGWIAALLLLFVPPIHLYKQLRGAYELSRFSAFWRLLVISSFIWIVIGLFLQLLFLLGAF